MVNHLRRVSASFFCIMLFLSSCMVGPNYHSPENQVSDQWSSSPIDSSVASGETPLTAWWRVFDDPLLTKYIERAAVNNYDLRTAEANILQARAMRTIAASSFFPKIGADVNATRLHLSKNGLISESSSAAGAATTTEGASSSHPHTQNLFSALFDATWEIDLFGKTRRSVQAADANIGSAIEQKNDTLITIMAEIARNYIEVRANQKLSKLVETNIALLELEALITLKQYESGYASLLNYETIQASLATERSMLPDLKAQIHRGIYTLSILTGDVPEALVEEMIVYQPIPKPPKKVSVGVRSDLLRRRPDVRQSERQLAAATANVGVAVASFFPSILLYGVGGFQSVLFKNLFTSGSKFWAFGGNVDIPIFEAGKLVGNLKANQAAAAAAACSYHQTVLTALEETESSLVSYAEDIAATSQLRSAVESERILVQLTKDRNVKGLVSAPNLIESERQLNAAEQSLVKSEMNSLIDLITLYKALGGGWEAEEEEKIETRKLSDIP